MSLSGNNAPTLHEDPRIADYIGRIVTGIVGRIVEEISPLSIYATGSLSKAELTAVATDRQVRLISDLEIAVVETNWLKRLRVRPLQERLSREFGVEVNLLFFLPKRFTQCAPSNWAFPGGPLSIEQYELISGARRLYGKDFAGSMREVDPSEIPKWQGIRLLFNRMAELVGALVLASSGKIDRLKAVNKLLTASGDALLLSTGRYHWLYRKRMEMLDGLTAEEIGGPGTHANQKEAIVRAYRDKLSGGVFWSSRPEQLLSGVLDICDMAFRTILHRAMGIRFADCDEFRRRYLRNPMLKGFCRSNARLDNIVSLLKHLRSGLPLPLRRYFGSIAVQHRVYVSVYCWLYGQFLDRWRSVGVNALADRDLLEVGRRRHEKWLRVCM